MEMLPNDVRQHRFKKSVRGYDTDEVDQFLEHVATVLEDTLTARQQAEEARGRLEQEIQHFREQENALKKAVVTVEQAMAQARNASEKEMEAVQRSAEVKARQIVHEAELEGRRLEQDLKFLKESRQGMIEQIRAFCKAQIATLDSLDQPNRAREAARQAVMPKRVEAETPPRPPAPAVTQPARLDEPAPPAAPVPAEKTTRAWQPERVSRDEVDQQIDAALGTGSEGDAAVVYPPPLVPERKGPGEQ